MENTMVTNEIKDDCKNEDEKRHKNNNDKRVKTVKINSKVRVLINGTMEEYIIIEQFYENKTIYERNPNSNLGEDYLVDIKVPKIIMNPDEGFISSDSKLGASLLGKKVNDIVSYYIDNKKYTVEIIDIYNRRTKNNKN